MERQMPEDRETVRVTRSKDDARSFYDRISRVYNLLSGSSERKFVEAGLEMLDVHRGETVLEIGFGTGSGLVALAGAVGEEGSVAGIDISSGMSRVALSRLEKVGDSGRVELQIGDAASLPYDNEAFDAIFMSFTLELFDVPELPLVLAECSRTLRHDGRICVVSMSNAGKHGLMTKAYLWAHRRLPRYVDCRPIYVRRSLERVGLEVVEDRLMTLWRLPVEIVLARKMVEAA
jgi:ubiquinone/menaquinone biosynthesis C-methylase UbiE